MVRKPRPSDASATPAVPPTPPPPVPPPSPGTPSGSQFTWQHILTIIGFILGVIGFTVKLFDDTQPRALLVVSIVVLVACSFFLGYLARRRIASTITVLHGPVSAFSPWLAILTFITSVWVLILVIPAHSSVPIRFDAGVSAVYNSWDHVPQHSKRLRAFGTDGGLAWTIADGGATGSFSYATDKAIATTEDATSGAYITFYGRPCDRLQYRSVHFRCKVTAATGPADLGVRLTVDNPKATKDRELIAYECNSLRRYSAIDETWRHFDIPLGDFRQARYQPPFPPNLDENSINKIVFFIGTHTSDQCPAATVWIGDVAFRR